MKSNSVDVQHRFWTDKRKYSFAQQLMTLWNSLSVEEMIASSVDGFKRGGEMDGVGREVFQWLPARVTKVSLHCHR